MEFLPLIENKIRKNDINSQNEVRKIQRYKKKSLEFLPKTKQQREKKKSNKTKGDLKVSWKKGKETEKEKKQMWT